MTGPNGDGDTSTPIRGPKFTFEVSTELWVPLVDHHALVEGITVAISCHGELVSAVERLIDAEQKLVDAESPDLSSVEMGRAFGDANEALDAAIENAKAVLTKVKSTP